MASQTIISDIKSFSTSLRDTLSELDIDLKHTKALEFTARQIYGYPSWNHVTGNSPDNRPQPSYQEFLTQVAALCRIVPIFSISEDDLAFTNGQPAFIDRPIFLSAASALATCYQRVEDPQRSFELYNFFELVADKYLPDSMFAHYPEAMRPKTAYERFQYGRINIEFPVYEFGKWPWDLWEKKLLAKGEITPELLSWARSAYREAIQHCWDHDIALFCGAYDDGKALEETLLKWPEKAQKVLEYLMNTDAGRMTE